MFTSIAIIGRPNVGKSTLFNRLIQRREAIVDSISGVTRDRHYGKGDWNGKEFSVIDTGGYVVGSDDIFESEIDHQVELAIDEADVILFMVDVDSGITSMDSEISDLLRKVDKPVFLVVNKVDNSSRINDVNEFYSLGLKELYPIASSNGFGTGELLDDVVKLFKDENEVIDLANNSPYGLASYFYSRDIGRIWRVAEALEYGVVSINNGLPTIAEVPFGGVKESGMGREGSRYGLDDYLTIKYISMGGI